MKALSRISRSMLLSLILLSLLLLTLFFSSCTTSPTTDPIEERMRELDTEIKALVGSAQCTATTQCHSIGFGDKPCGGFSSYLVYSEQNTDVYRLKNRVDKYNKLSQAWNRQHNISSTCDMLMPPSLNCHQQVCQREN